MSSRSRLSIHSKITPREGSTAICDSLSRRIACRSGSMAGSLFPARSHHNFQADRTSGVSDRSEEHTSELQSLMRISYAVFCLKKNKTHNHLNARTHTKK